MHPGVAYARKGAIRGAAIGGLGLGAVGAALGGLPKTHHNRNTDKTEKRTKGQRIAGAISGGLGMGILGATQGAASGFNHRARKWNAGFRPDAPRPKAPDWLKGVKTRAEARRAYHAQARKAHPDSGGSEEAIKRLNLEWEKHEPHFKTAMLHAFADELEKIAALGAIAGGALGYKIAPNSVKGKIYGALGGAAVGSIVGSAAQRAKEMVWDEPRAREYAALHGYAPYAGQQPGAPTNFY